MKLIWQVELTYADEGVLKYGYRVQLQSDFMDAIVCKNKTMFSRE